MSLNEHEKCMKYLILSLIIFLLSCSDVKQKNDGELRVTINFCKYINSRHKTLEKITLLKGNLDFKSFNFNREEELVIPNLNYGIYKIKYKSIYNKYEYIDFEINNNLQQTISICLDKINYKENNNILLIDEMKVGEVLIFDFASQGCFHSGKEEIKLIKNKDNIIATYNESEVKLTDSQYKLFREFEIELRSNHTGWCSTKDKYRIYNEQTNEIYSVNDETCKWSGFRNLIKLLELEK